MRSPRPCSARAPGHRHGRGGTWVLPLFLLSPALVLLGGIVAYPIGRAVWLSVHHLEILRPDQTQFVGLQNYRELWQDPVLRIALGNSAVWVLGVVLFQLLGGLAGAFVLNRQFAGRAAVRGLALIPWATPSVLVALMWTWMLDGNYGLINDLLVKMGLLSRFQPWLAQPWSALPAVMLADIWQGIPFFAVMLLAALQAIPEELFEAGRIDGASAWRLFRHVTFPLLLPTVLITSMLRMIWTANYMDLIMIMTGGGPGYSSLTVPLHAYYIAYKRLDFGYGSAIAIVQVAVLALAIVAYLRQLRKTEVMIQ
jgi:multiple sugar transport system permease protein